MNTNNLNTKTLDTGKSEQMKAFAVANNINVIDLPAVKDLDYSGLLGTIKVNR
jgi:hypothetical protein